MDECVSYLVEIQRISAWNRKSRTHKAWRNFTFLRNWKNKTDKIMRLTLHVQCKIDRHLRVHDYTHSFLKFREFASSKSVLEGTARVIREDGRRRRRNKSSSLTTEEEEALWTSVQLGDQALSYSIPRQYYITRPSLYIQPNVGLFPKARRRAF